MVAAPVLASPLQGSPNVDGRIPALLVALLVVALLGAVGAVLLAYRRRS